MTMLYPNPCYSGACYNEIELYSNFSIICKTYIDFRCDVSKHIHSWLPVFAAPLKQPSSKTGTRLSPGRSGRRFADSANSTRKTPKIRKISPV